jgi:hypothetical protein
MIANPVVSSDTLPSGWSESEAVWLHDFAITAMFAVEVIGAVSRLLG